MRRANARACASALTRADSIGSENERAGGCGGRIQRSITWGSYNLPTAITKRTTSLAFWYGTGHERVKQTATVAGTTTTSVERGFT